MLNLKGGEKVFLFSHNDTDGITSAIIFKKGLKQLGKKVSKIFTLKIEESDRLFSELKRFQKINCASYVLVIQTHDDNQMIR